MSNAPIQYVTENELIGILTRINTAQPFGVVALTMPSCFSTRRGGSRKKTEPLCPPVMKRQRVSGISNFDYLRSRNNDNAREWSRQVEALKAEGKTKEAADLEQQGPEQHELGSRSDDRERIEGTVLVRRPSTGHVYLQMMIPTGHHPSWPKGRHETSYCYLPDHRGLLLESYAKGKPSKAHAEAYPEHVLAAIPAVEYSLEGDGDESLADWLKPYKRRDDEPHDFDYREYRFDHILEVRAEGIRYIVRRGEEAQAKTA